MVMMARAYESIYDIFADPNMFEILMDPIKYNKLIRSLPQARNSDLSWMFEDRQYAFKNAGEFQKFLITRDVKPEDIKEAFRNANLEDGLYAFGEPELDISVIDRTPSNINVDNGKTINLTCRLRAFPKPEFSLNFKGQSLPVQVKYDSINGCFECIFEKNTAREIDSGPYALTMKQTKRNRYVSEVVLHFSVNVGRDFVTKEFYVRVDPMECAVNPGNEINLKANVNCEDPSQFTYEWHFMRFEIESKVENADTENLVIKNCSIEDMGTYRCLVQHKASGKKKWSENRAKVNSNEISEFELKIMLIIGNADYVTSDCPSEECNEKYKDIGSMDIYESLAKIRHEMEQLGFITMSFLNLNPQEYKRSLALFRRLCEPAQRVYVLVYVAGHGHNYLGKDYLIPTDSQRHYHFSGHRNYLRDSMSLSLNYLMECFVSTVAVPVVDEPHIDGSSDPKNNAVDLAVSETTHLITNNEKFTVGIFWDLCRSNVKTYADFHIKKDVFDYPYMILFSCNVGRQGYYLDQEFDDQNFKLEKGSIFSNLFLKNLNRSLGIYDIGVRMNDDIKLLQKDKAFNLLNKIMIEGQALRMKIGLVASSNKEYERHLCQFYIVKNQKNLISSDKKKIVSYYFDKDEFINTVLLVVETKLKISLNFDSRLQVKAIDENQDGKKIYRIFNILRCDIKPHQTPILMTVHDWVPNYEVDENGETGRLAWQFELDFQHVAEHFQRLSAIMDEPLPKAGTQENASSEEDSDLHSYDRPNSIDSEFSLSSASLTTSAERTVEDSFESSSIASSDDNY